MLRLQKNEHILKALRNREIGTSGSSYKLTLGILHGLIISEDRKFQETWKRKSKKRIHQDCGKLFFNNFTDVLSIWGISNKPSRCFRISCKRSRRKVLDVLLCPLSEIWPIANNRTVETSSLESSILVLFKNNWLHSYNLETGAVRNEFYLGEFKLLFKHCDWDIYRRQITVMSNPRHEKVIHIAVFTFAPFEYRAMMSITKSIFVHKCNSLNVSDSMLVVGVGTLSNGCVRIFNFEDLLSENILFSANLGLPCPDFDDQLIGTFPAGLPMNCRIRGLPPLLFEVPCANLNVNFGGYPWHYLITPPKHKFVFNIRNVSDHVMAVNGELADSELQFEEGSAHFHFDGSERIIHTLPNSINVYKLIADNQLSKVELFSKMGFLPKNESNVSPSRPSVPTSTRPPVRTSTRPQRKAALCAPDFCDISNVKSVLCMDYENELDLTAVLGFNPSLISDDEKIKAQVNFYDNFSGSLKRSMDLLTFFVHECDDYSMYMELDTLVVLVRSFRNGCYYCHIFKLT